MTASQKPKTPSMTMKIRPDVSSEDIELFCKRSSRVRLSQVVDKVNVQEQLRVEGDARRTQFTIELNFFPKAEYQAEYDIEPMEILSVFATKFPLILKREMQNEMKKLDADLRSQIAELGKGKKTSRGGGDEDEEVDAEVSEKKADDVGSEVGDGDADDEKRAKQRKQQATYDSDDEEEDEDLGAYDDSAIEAAYASDAEEEDTNDKVFKNHKTELLKAQISRISDLFQRNLHVATLFEFDESRCTFQVEVRNLCAFQRFCS
jgi:DNA-directed RNA polymerase I subunit RPA1